MIVYASVRTLFFSKLPLYLGGPKKSELKNELIFFGSNFSFFLCPFFLCAQEEFAFGTLLCSEQPRGDLREAGGGECARSVVEMSRVASVRVAAAGAIMLGWGSTMYVSSVWDHTRTNTCFVAAAVYPLLVFVLGVARNLCRTILPGARDEDDAKNGNVRGGGGAMLRFITTQAYLDNAYVVAWDAIGIFFKGWLVIGLSTRGYDTWV